MIANSVQGKKKVCPSLAHDLASSNITHDRQCNSVTDLRVKLLVLRSSHFFLNVCTVCTVHVIGFRRAFYRIKLSKDEKMNRVVQFVTIDVVLFWRCKNPCKISRLYFLSMSSIMLFFSYASLSSRIRHTNSYWRKWYCKAITALLCAVKQKYENRRVVI